MNSTLLVNAAFFLNGTAFFGGLAVLSTILTRTNERLNNETIARMEDLFNKDNKSCTLYDKCQNAVGSFIKTFYSYKEVSALGIFLSIVLFLGVAGLFLSVAGAWIDSAYTQSQEQLKQSLTSYNNIIQLNPEMIASNSMKEVGYVPYNSFLIAISLGLLNLVFIASLFIKYGLLNVIIESANPAKPEK